MTTPAAAISAVATAANQVTGLRVHGTVPGSISPPAAVVELAGITAPASLGSTADYRVRVTLLSQRGDQRNSQERTLALIDPTGTAASSVFAALLTEATVGQVEFEGPGLIEFGGQQYVGGVFTAEVYG